MISPPSQISIERKAACDFSFGKLYFILTLNGAGRELGEGGIGGGEDSQGSLAGESVSKSAGSDGGYGSRD